MKMRHLWRWPVLCSMLFGFASAGSAAAVQAPGPADAGESLSRSSLPRLAHDPQLHGRIETIGTWMREARTSQNRPAALRLLADRVEHAAGRMADSSVSTGLNEAAVQAVIANLLAGADALRSPSKLVRTAGLARIDGALHEHGQRFDPPSRAAMHSSPSRT